MRLGRAIGGVTCHHRVAHALSAKGPKAEGKGGAQGFAFPHYLAGQCPGNAAKEQPTVSTHLSVWAHVCSGFMVASSLSDSVLLHENLSRPENVIYSHKTPFDQTHSRPPLSPPLCKHPSCAILSNNTCTAMFLWYVLSLQSI